MDSDVQRLRGVYQACGSKWTLHWEIALAEFLDELRARFRGSSDELLLLDWIDKHPGRHATQAEIGRELGMTRDRAAMKLKRLETDGQIRRTKRPRCYERIV